MRILASADIHLGSPIKAVAMRNEVLGEQLKQVGRDILARIADLAIAENVGVLVLSGDIFDNDCQDLKLQTYLRNQLMRVSEAGISTVFIRGNHDAHFDHSNLGELGPRLHLLDKTCPTVEIDGCAFHGLSFDAKHSKKSFLPDYPQAVAGLQNVGLMHTSLDGAEGHDPYAPCSEADLLAHGYDLWCLGHIHKPSEKSSDSVQIVMPGTPQPRHIGERHGGQVALIELIDGSSTLQWRDVAMLKFVELHVDLNPVVGEASAIDVLSQEFKAIASDSYAVAVRLVAISNQFTRAGLEDIAGECLSSIEGVYLDKVKVKPADLEKMQENDDLLRLMQDEFASDAFKQSAKEVFAELWDALPAELRKQLNQEEVQDGILNEALQEVAAHLRAGQ